MASKFGKESENLWVKLPDESDPTGLPGECAPWREPAAGRLRRPRHRAAGIRNTV